MPTKTYQLQTLTCPSCIHHIEKSLVSQPEIEAVNVSFNSSKVKVTHTEAANTDDIKATIEKLGYEVLDEK